mgnify:CR=1 FL=1
MFLLKSIDGGWRRVQKNGSIPYTPLEQLFWKRISNLKKMIKSLKGKKHRAYRSMWRGKLYELTKQIGEKV